MTLHQIQAEALTTFDVASDGSHIRMHLREANGNPAALILPADCLNQLLMTLPSMVQTALSKRSGNDRTRLVHSIDECRLETAELDDHGVRQLVLTLGTGGGFKACYAALADTLASIARFILDQIPMQLAERSAPVLLS